ncbi:MAG: zinc ribbon domain-containing protein [Anaerostipes sp.]|uniref:zinc ribbon domain-containing protein n=1 Tax=Anaerostipes sp. TaxID=1872530 RepID=UPI00399502EC
MALIKCPECKNQISDTASTCPNCGYQMRSPLKYNSNVYPKKPNLLNNKQRQYIKYCKNEITKLKNDIETIDDQIKEYIAGATSFKDFLINYKSNILIIIFLLFLFLYANITGFLFFALILFILAVICAMELDKDIQYVYKKNLSIGNVIKNPDYYRNTFITSCENEIEEYQTLIEKIKNFDIDLDDIPVGNDVIYYNEQIPRCPTCGSANIQKISIGAKIADVSSFGLFSSNIRKPFKCNNCGYKW